MSSGKNSFLLYHIWETFQFVIDIQSHHIGIIDIVAGSRWLHWEVMQILDKDSRKGMVTLLQLTDVSHFIVFENNRATLCLGGMYLQQNNKRTYIFTSLIYLKQRRILSAFMHTWRKFQQLVTSANFLFSHLITCCSRLSLKFMSQNRFQNPLLFLEMVFQSFFDLFSS